MVAERFHVQHQGKSKCARPFHTSTWITFATIHPTGQSKLNDQFQHQYDSYLRVWRWEAEAFVVAFAIQLLKFKLVLKAFPRKAYQACFCLHTIALSFLFSWSTLPIFGQSFNPLSNATSHLRLMSKLNGVFNHIAHLIQTIMVTYIQMASSSTRSDISKEFLIVACPCLYSCNIQQIISIATIYWVLQFIECYYLLSAVLLYICQSRTKEVFTLAPFYRLRKWNREVK